MAYQGITTPLDASANNPNANFLGNPGSPTSTPSAPTPTPANLPTNNPNNQAITQGTKGTPVQIPTPAPSGTPVTSTVPSTPINTSTPNPATASTTAPTSGTINPNDPSVVDALNATGQASDIASRTALASKYGITGYTGTADQNAQLLQKYTAALATAKASGASAPQSQGSASAATTGITGGPTPPTPPPNPIQSQLDNDPGYKQLVADQNEYLSSQNQGESLVQQYTDLSTKLGIPAIDTQLVNMNAVINGTEQDIRNEIQSAGGFATESQIQAMATARNKVLTQNYNNLLQTKSDLMTQLTTLTGLAKDDQANATALAGEKLNYDQQVMTYEQKFQQNAQDSLKSMQSTEGWDGIYKAALATGDPTAVQQINATMGQGFDLATAAQQDAQTKALAAQNAQIAQQQAQENLTKTNADIASTKASTINTQATTAKTNAEIAALPGSITPVNSLPYNGSYKSPTDYVNAVLSKQGVSYASAESNTPKGTVSAIDNQTGQTVIIDAKDWNASSGSIRPQYTVIYNNI